VNKGNRSLDDRVARTVLGDIPAHELGVTLAHEHLIVTLVNPNFTAPREITELEMADEPMSRDIFEWVLENWTNNRDNLVLDDEELAIAEVLRYRRAGGVSLVDVTSVGIGRDPMALTRIAQATDLNIIMGCGYYVEATHPVSLEGATDESIASELINDVRVGANETSVRAGIIGEIGCSWPLGKREVIVLRGAALAQQELKCGLSISPGKHPNAPFELMRLLEQTGAESTRVIMCHIERTLSKLAEIEALADSGCYLEFDLFGVQEAGAYYDALGITIPTDTERLDQIRRLMSNGYADRVLISQDVGSKHRLTRYGGHGYEHILVTVVPLMRDQGFTDDDIRQVLINNPRDALTLVGTR
jgi:phosphotriesterase-related protein